MQNRSYEDNALDLVRAFTIIFDKELVMPIPGDNGQPAKEKKAQENRITEVANKDACVQKEVRLNAPAPKEKNIFGVM